MEVLTAAFPLLTPLSTQIAPPLPALTSWSMKFRYTESMSLISASGISVCRSDLRVESLLGVGAALVCQILFLSPSILLFQL